MIVKFEFDYDFQLDEKIIQKRKELFNNKRFKREILTEIITIIPRSNPDFPMYEAWVNFSGY